jgi:hypothetical protein
VQLRHGLDDGKLGGAGTLNGIAKDRFAEADLDGLVCAINCTAFSRPGRWDFRLPGNAPGRGLLPGYWGSSLPRSQT